MARPSNTVILIGRITKDLVVNYYGEEQQNAVSKFTLAVDRGRKNAEGQSESDFVSCVAFGKTAEFIEKYFGKGSKIAVEGEIRTGSYTNKEGQKVYTTDVNIDKADFVESKASSQTHYEANGGGQASRQDNYPPKQSNGYREPQGNFKKASDVGDGFMAIPEDVEDGALPWN